LGSGPQSATEVHCELAVPESPCARSAGGAGGAILVVVVEVVVVDVVVVVVMVVTGLGIRRSRR
jgi:hypothetical protein